MRPHPKQRKVMGVNVIVVNNGLEKVSIGYYFSTFSLPIALHYSNSTMPVIKGQY